MPRFFKTLALIIALPLVYAFLVEGFRFLTANLKPLLLNWMTYGFVFYLILYFLFLRSRLRFFEIFEHELGHMLMAALFRIRVADFHVTLSGGGVEYVRPSNAVVRLAPYYLSVFTLPWLIFKPFATTSVHQSIDFFIGLTLAFHCAALAKEFRHWQPDIRKTGLFLAIVIVLFLNTLFAVFACSFALNKYSYVFNYFKQSLVTALHAYQAIGQILAQAVAGFNQTKVSLQI